MQRRIQLNAGLALTVAAVSFGLLAGCGGSDDGGTDATTTGATAVTGTTGSTTEKQRQGEQAQDRKDAAKQKAAQERSPDGGQGGHEGHNPASAGDKRGKAPDDVISDRPGGPSGGQPVSP